MAIPSEHLHPHVDSDTCGRCRKEIKGGHRVLIAHIVEKVGVDPRNLQSRGIYLLDEYEFIHANCNDPFLVKGLT